MIAWKFADTTLWFPIPSLAIDDYGRLLFGGLAYFDGGNPVYAPVEDEY